MFVYLRAHVLGVRAYVLACLACLRACLLGVFACLRACMLVLCLRASYDVFLAFLPSTYSRFCLIIYFVCINQSFAIKKKAVDICKFELTGVIIKKKIAKQQVS